MKLENYDQGLQNEIRTRQGAFFTPKLWVDEAHKEIEKQFGKDWRNENIVWDCCAGTGNLFRDYDFKDLIVSTLSQDELDLLNKQGYVDAFKYDFLNPTDIVLETKEKKEKNSTQYSFFDLLGETSADSNVVETTSDNKSNASDVDTSALNVIPANVQKKLRQFAKDDKRLLFFINPPYAASGTLKDDEENKTGVSDTLVKEKMKHLGACRSNLYFQFIFECIRQANLFGFKKISLCFFSPIKFMIQETAIKFRSWFYNEFEFKNGFFFNASAFAGVSSEWGVGFTIWNEGKNINNPMLDIRELDGTSTGKIKNIYNCDNQKSASEWVREPIKGMETYEYPIMTSGLKIKERQKTGPIKKAPPKDIPHIVHPPIPFTQKWLDENGKYKYTALETKVGYEQWVDDCHIYSIFETKNNCTSMRDVSWGGEIWQIKNHFFWLERFGICGLLQKYPTIKADYEKYYEESYVATLIADLTLSKEAIDVLEQATSLWLKSLDKREAYALANPDLQLNCWDCGWYQLKTFWEKEYNTDFKALKDSHKKLGDKLRPGVYEYGFLKE